MPTYKPVGVDENSLFPPRVEAAHDAKYNGTYAPGGTAGNINASTAQGIALVQSLIFGS